MLEVGLLIDELNLMIAKVQSQVNLTSAIEKGELYPLENKKNKIKLLHLSFYCIVF